MPVGHLHRIFDDFGRGGRFGKIGDPNDEAAAALFGEQDARGAGMIRLGSFAMNLRQAINDGAQMQRAAAGGNVVLDGAAISEQTHAVTTLRGNLSQGESGIDGIIQFRKTKTAALFLNFRAEQPAGVKDNPDGLAALDFENASSELMAARGGGPANVAQVVALPVIAEAFKFPAVTALATTAFLHFNLAAADQVERVLASLLEIGKNAHRLRNFGSGPALGKSELRLIAEKQTAQADVSAFARENLVAGLCLAAGPNSELNRRRR